MATIYYNENPCGKAVGDCVLRALSIALEQPWRMIYLDLAIQGYIMCDLMSSNSVWGAYLKDRGFIKHIIAWDGYTINDFCYDHPVGVYVVGTGDHVVAVIDGIAYDAWDSSREEVLCYFERAW